MQNEISLSLYIYRSFSYFTNILWDKKYIPMRIWPYASSSVHVTDLETVYLSRLSEYGTEENLDWIYAIWFWPVLHLTLLVFFVFLLYFHLLCFVLFFYPSSWAVFVTFVLTLAVYMLDYFLLFRLLNSLFRLYSMLHEEKQVIGVCSASVGKCFFYKFI